MKKTETKTSTGGRLIEYFDAQGRRVRAVHISGNNYSGKNATEPEPKKVDWFTL